ncbi:MAG: hypothetical protein IJ523_08965 [Succinivibrionaceae bacterium]|nr:hypothetical protein [Succinivibrionaceae bacterium]
MRLLAFVALLLASAAALALPEGWQRIDAQDGTITFRHPGNSKAVTFADITRASSGAAFDFSGMSDMDRYRVLSGILQDLGYCTDRAVYDTATFMLYCRGRAKDEAGVDIPVIAYVKMEDTHLMLILGMYNATRQDVFDLIREPR